MSEGKFDKISTITDYIKKCVHYRPVVGIICGTGFDSIADLVVNPRIIRYDDIPGFPNCEVIGNEGSFLFGQIGRKDTVILQRRFHASNEQATGMLALPIRVLKHLGTDYIFITTAVAGINYRYRAGDLMMIQDHVDFSSLIGKSPPPQSETFSRFCPGFPALQETYNKRLRDLARKSAVELKIEDSVHEGVYFHIAGPAYQTPATVQMLRNLGCDVIGMKILQEVMSARILKLKVFAVCLIVNPAVSSAPIDQETEMKVSKQHFPIAGRLIERLISNLC